MLDETSPNTRTRILRAALREFGAHGFHATSVQRIAKRVGITKTAVLYHFPSKAEILAGLVAPLIDALEAAVGAAELAEDPAWTAIENVLEAYLAHRHLLRMNLEDLGVLGSGKPFQRFRNALLGANRLVAGGRSDLASRVRAAQAIAMLSDPVILHADAPTAALRACVLHGVRALLPAAPLPKAPATSAGRRRGRPPALSATAIVEARRRHRRGASAAVIAAELGVSRATLYRILVSK